MSRQIDTIQEWLSLSSEEKISAFCYDKYPSLYNEFTELLTKEAKVKQLAEYIRDDRGTLKDSFHRYFSSGEESDISQTNTSQSSTEAEKLSALVDIANGLIEFSSSNADQILKVLIPLLHQIQLNDKSDFEELK